MKTFIFIFAFGWMVSFASASEIIISSYDRSEISVTLDGFRVNGRSKQLFLSDVAPGNHVMEVFALRRSPRHGMNLIKIYSGSFFINANTRLEMKVNAYNEIVVLRNEPLFGNHGNNYSCSNNSYNGLIMATNIIMKTIMIIIGIPGTPTLITILGVAWECPNINLIL